VTFYVLAFFLIFFPTFVNDKKRYIDKCQREHIKIIAMNTSVFVWLKLTYFILIKIN